MMSATIGEKAMEFDKLVRLLEQELVTTGETIRRSPLLQAACKSAQAHITRNTHHLKGLGLSTRERHDRLEAEAASKGLDVVDLLYEHTVEDMEYWPLQLSEYVYTLADGIRKIGSDEKLWPVINGMLTQDEIEDIIPSLRLLCSPSNGGIPAT